MVCMLQINMSECVHSVYSGFEESMCVCVCVCVCTLDGLLVCSRMT